MKEGRGGSRDVAIVRSLAKVTTVVTTDERFEDAIAALFDVRVALQRVAGHTDRLLLEHQDRVAEQLGLGDADELDAPRQHRRPHRRDAVGRRLARGAGVAAGPAWSLGPGP